MIDQQCSRTVCSRGRDRARSVSSNSSSTSTSTITTGENASISVIKKCHGGVPDCEHQKQKREGHMDKKPAVEPMVQTHLQIEHAPLVAPGLDFFDAAAVALGHA